MSEPPVKLRMALVLIASAQIAAGGPVRISARYAAERLGCSVSSWRRHVRELSRRGWIRREIHAGRGQFSTYAVRIERQRPWLMSVGPNGVSGSPGTTETKAPAPRADLPAGLREYLLSWREKDPRYYAQLLALYQAS